MNPETFKIDEELIGDLSTFLGDDLKSVIDIFLSHSDDLLIKIRQACVSQETEYTVRLLHSFKGGAKNIGALSLAAMCGSLEDHAKAQQFDIVLANLSFLEQDVEQLKRVLPNYVPH